MADKRIGLVGFHTRTGEVFRSLGLNIVSHIFANPDDKAAKSDDEKLINFHDWKQYRVATRPVSSDALRYRQELHRVCFRDFIRCTDRWDWSKELVNDWSDYEHLFSLAFDDAWAWFSDQDLDQIVYSNVPHQGIAVVQYNLARLMGLETRIFIQSPFAGRSWLVDHWSDLGEFNSSLPGEPFEIDISKPKKQPFYMNKVRGEAGRKLRVLGHKFRARTVVGLGLTGFGAERRRRSFLRNMNRWQRAVQDEFYLGASNRFFADAPRKDDYVYFPLHLQPEMTTDILGGNYADQISALERLRQIVPTEVSICVKENPKQMGQLRGQAFFDRAERIPNVRFLSRKVSSFDLIENAMAVATISGTAGWEALRMGKAAIIFGDAFWSRLPGVFRVDDIQEWKNISDFRFDKKILEDAVSDLSRHAHPGICDPYYAAVANKYDEKENAQQLADALIKWSGLK